METEEAKDIYYKEGIEDSIDDDQINSTEEGFMQGYLGAI